MIRPRPKLSMWSQVRAVALGRGAALAVALSTWAAAASAKAADLSMYLSVHAAPIGLGVEGGTRIATGGDCGGFFGYALSFDSMLFEVQSAPCGGFRAFDVAFLAVVAMIVIAALRFRHATARRRLDLASRMVEKGIEPPPELVGAAGTNDLRRGLVLVSTGIGLSLASFMSSGGMSPAGLIPGFIGLGYLVSHRFAVKKPGRSA